MKKLNLLLIILFLVQMSFAQITGKVIKIKDGDTVVVLDENNTQHTIRVADIDTPEKAQPFGNKAKKFTSAEVFGKIVFVKKKGIDRYKRIIGFIIYDNKNLSEELLKNGFAWFYFKYSNNKTLNDLEIEARRLKKGLWIDKKPIAPWNWRRNKN